MKLSESVLGESVSKQDNSIGNNFESPWLYISYFVLLIP